MVWLVLLLFSLLLLSVFLVSISSSSSGRITAMDFSLLRPLKVDAVLRSRGMQRITNYPYASGDCFFDSVCYAMRWSASTESTVLRRKTVNNFVRLLRDGDKRALEWKDTFFELENLRELHPGLGEASSTKEQCMREYFKRMKLDANVGGLWGDHFCVYWTQEYLRRPILIWLAETGKLYDGNGADTWSEDDMETAIHLVYHTSWCGTSVSHYEPVQRCRQPGLLDSSSDEDYELEESWWDEEDFPHYKMQALVDASAQDEEQVGTSDTVESAQLAVVEPRALEESPAAELTVTVPEDTTVAIESTTATSETAALPLKRFSSACVEQMRKEARKDPYQLQIEAAIASKQHRNDQQQKRMRVDEAELIPLANFEVHDMLLKKHADTNSFHPAEERVFKYLAETRAGDESFYSSRSRLSSPTDRPWSNMTREPLFSRLRGNEHLMMANLRPKSPVEVNMIVENMDSRFTEKEVLAVIDKIIEGYPDEPTGKENVQPDSLLQN